MKTKTCTKCGKVKNLDLFHKDSRNKDGYKSSCKECKIIYQGQYRKTSVSIDAQEKYQNSEAGIKVWKKASKKYQGTKKGKESRLKCAARHKKRYPEKTKARQALTYAVAHGNIKKGICAICGASNVEGHHPDYSKPLDIIWLCRKHHNELHEKL